VEAKEIPGLKMYRLGTEEKVEVVGHERRPRTERSL
jgi:hypothetical protein